jgi:hypothetical protein
MSDPLEMICDIAGCSKEEAEMVFSETKDVVESVDRLMKKTESSWKKYIPLKSEPILTEAQVKLKKLREITTKIEESRGPTLLNRSGGCAESSQESRPEPRVQ